MASDIKILKGWGIFFFGVFIILIVSSVLTSGAVGNYQSETNLYFFGSIPFLILSIVMVRQIKKERENQRNSDQYGGLFTDQQTAYKDLPRKPFPEWVKQATLRNQDGKCNLCSMPLSNYVAEYDHIDNDKTNNQPSNCQALCANCHSEKTKRSR